MSRRSVVGKGVLAAGSGNTVDSADTSEAAVILDGVGGGSRADLAGLGVADRPRDRDRAPVDPSNSLDEGAGDDPGEVEVSVGTLGDREHAGVLVPLGVDSVDDVVAGDPGIVRDGVIGKEEEPGHEHQQQKGETPADHAFHGGEGTDPFERAWRALKQRRGLQLLTAIVGLLVMAVMAFTIFEPIQVLPRIRPAPGFIMADQTGTSFTSEDMRGQVTLYSFAHAGCGDRCAEMNATLAEVQDRLDGVDLGGADFEIVTVSFDATDTAEDLAGAAASAGADGVTWRWATVANEEAVIGAGFRVFFERNDSGYRFDPVFIIVDGYGVIRGEYRYQTLVDDADRLVNHVNLLGEELRNSTGAATVAYEAAHLFLCYP